MSRCPPPRSPEDPGGLRSASIGEEPVSGLASEPARPHQSAEHRGSAIARFAALLRERVQYQKHLVKADLVRPGEDATGVVQSQRHARVDVLSASQPFAESECC